VLCTVAAISFWSLRPRAAAGWLAGALALWASLARWGLAQGLAVALLLAMSSATVLVLLLAPRMHWARPVALGSAALGTAALAWGSWC
jgi:hypothetical protein